MMMTTNYEEVKLRLKNLSESPLTSNEYACIISDLEKEISKEMITSELSLENFPFYQNAYKRVADLDDNLKSKNLLMIGMGPLPATLFYAIENGLAENCVGIDSDIEAVELANKLAKKLNIKNISFKHIDGREFNYSEFDSVFIANLVKGKAEILKKLENELPSNALVVLREPWGLGESLAEVGRSSLGGSWEIEKEGAKCSNFYSQNIFINLKRKEMNLD
jgi:hypothetical protein